MATYIAYIPNQMTAEIDDAPDARHARTALLDWLTRTGRIEWKDRRKVRKMILAKKTEPDTQETDIHLNYTPSGYMAAEEPPPDQAQVELPPQDWQHREEERAVEQAEPPQPPTLPIGEPTTQVPVEVLPSSPIAQVSRGMGRVRIRVI